MDKIKQLRLQNSLTQQEFAKTLNIKQQYLSRYETGLSEPDIQTLCKIADYYGVSLDYLCDHKTMNQLDYGQIDEAHKKAHNILQALPDAEFYLEFGRLQTKADMLGIKY